MPAPAFPPDFETWTFEGGAAAARRDVAPAVRQALAAGGTLYGWAAARPDRATFLGRGEAYGVALGGTAAVVRHARHGGLLAPLLGDRFWGRPRFEREADLSRRLAAGGVPTPALLAAVRYRAGLGHRADVATEQVAGADLVELFYGAEPPAGAARTAVLDVLGRLVRRLHDLGWVHPDLQLRNLVVSDPAARAPRAWLLDVDTCRPMRGDADAERARNLARFYRSWAKWNALRGERLTDADRAQFSVAYLTGEP
ncbi:MAG TPA: lipopolysaccharide kinase InaA family protein [Gemmatimonadales bacterium]|nr:lipopolysaccharide kinase InaA family protein [Gemmatimonadales bacterium]